jgi:hypothetical protein
VNRGFFAVKRAFFAQNARTVTYIQEDKREMKPEGERSNNF